MNMNLEEKTKKSSLVKTDEGIFEMIYDPNTQVTKFVGYCNGDVVIKDFVETNGGVIFPFPPDADLVRNKVILFPTEPSEYGNDKDLIDEIANFIHKYLEISSFFEKIAPYYVLLTWTYDSFKELPYLRAIGDYGSGKSRFLKVVGSVCYKPMFTMGATTSAPIFRLIDLYKGTLILDEADLRFSDTNVDIIKILNNGFQTGLAILRCKDRKNPNDIASFDVFCPKIVATRNKFEDKALESRFLVERMDGKLTRRDVPINLNDSFDQEATVIRNKCLMWRLRNYGKKAIDLSVYDHSVESRLNQIIAPLLSIINDQNLRLELMEMIRGYGKELMNDRGMSFEGQVLETIINIRVGLDERGITMKRVAEGYNHLFSSDETVLSPRKIGEIVRNKLHLKVVKKMNGFVLEDNGLNENLEKLAKKYGFDFEHMNVMNISKESKKGEGSLQKELDDMGLQVKY